jgi:hypothetical protein
MSWHDPARATESAEDRELRLELCQLLGAPAPDFFEVQPTAEVIALAEELRKEALRRRRTARHRPATWMLLAAGLPIALALTGLTTWGVQQKHRADALAVAMQQQQVENRRMALASVQPPREAQELERVAVPKGGKAGKRPATRPGELVIPVERALIPATDTQRVKAQGN